MDSQLNILRNSWIYNCLRAEVDRPHRSSKYPRLGVICSAANKKRPPFVIDKHEVANIISDFYLKIYAVYSAELKAHVLKNLRCCSSKKIQSLEGHSLICFKCEVDVRHSISARDCNNKSGTSKYKCPQEYHVVLVIKEMDSSGCSESQVNNSSNPPKKSNLWYHDIDECDSLIQTIIKNKLDNEYERMKCKSTDCLNTKNLGNDISEAANSTQTDECAHFETWQSEEVLKLASKQSSSSASREWWDCSISQDSVNENQENTRAKCLGEESCTDGELHGVHYSTDVMEATEEIIGSDSPPICTQPGSPFTNTYDPLLVTESPVKSSTNSNKHYEVDFNNSIFNSGFPKRGYVNSWDNGSMPYDEEECGSRPLPEDMEIVSDESIAPELRELGSLSPGRNESALSGSSDKCQEISKESDEDEEVDVVFTEGESVAIDELSFVASSNESQSSLESTRPTKLNGIIAPVPFDPHNTKSSQEVQNEFGFILLPLQYGSHTNRAPRHDIEKGPPLHKARDAKETFADFRISEDLMSRTLHNLYRYTMVNSPEDQQECIASPAIESNTVVQKQNSASVLTVTNNLNGNCLQTIQYSKDLMKKTYHYLKELSS